MSTVDPNWTEIGHTEHIVQFFKDEALLNAAVFSFFEAGLGAGEAVVIIAARGRCRAIELQLTQAGFDLPSLKAAEQFFSLDAAETLSRFMVDGVPDAGLFNVSAGGIMARATRNQRPVRVFGEMVALLWSQGNKDAAVAVEELWNHLAKTYSFALFCAYPLENFLHPEDNVGLVNICNHHSRVIPG